MSKTRDTGYLANVIQVHDTGVRIMSGSTMLMAVSSSGAVTITGEISGSDAANSLLLSGTGSVGFTTTSSFLAVSSSQQQVSASYISLSGSYNTFSGSASTRITENSSSIQQVSSSQQQISSSLLQVSASYISLSGSYTTFSGSASTRITVDSASLLQVSSSQQQISASLLNVISIFATTGSNSFRATQSITGSLTVTGQIIAQTLNVQQVTSSIIYSSGSNVFGCDLNSRQTFTGSVNITGSQTVFGNVGIGLNNPIAPLTIKSSGATGVFLSCDTTNAGASSRLFFESCYNQFSILNNAGKLQFNYAASAPSTSGVLGMVMDSSGSLLVGTICTTMANASCIGIGTQTPVSLLHINTSLTTADILRISNGTQILTLGVNNGAGGSYIFENCAQDFRIGTCATERMRITSGGAVGIGTCTPTDKLHILGADNGITICAASVSRPVLSFINGSCTMLKLSANATYGAIADNAGSDVMFFKNGNIGIGTSSPSGTGVVLNVKGIIGNTTSMAIAESQDAGSMVSLYSGAGSGDHPSLIYLKDLRFGSGNKDTSGYVERPKYNEEQLKKAVNVVVDELIAAPAKPQPKVVPQKTYDRLETIYNESLGKNTDLSKQLSDALAKIETLNTTNEALATQIDVERLLRASAENESEITNNKYVSLIQDFQNALSKGIKEGIERVSLEAQLRGLQAEKQTFDELQKNLTAQLDAANARGIELQNQVTNAQQLLASAQITASQAQASAAAAIVEAFSMQFP